MTACVPDPLSLLLAHLVIVLLGLLNPWTGISCDNIAAKLSQKKNELMKNELITHHSITHFTFWQTKEILLPYVASI